jgi:hypothetical protein
VVHRIDTPFSSPRRLSQSVVQAGELLGLVRAEVARVLGFKCESISALYDGRLLLEEGTSAWLQGDLFIRFYNLLYDRFDGDGVRMVHWFRADNRELEDSPFLLIIDHGELARVVAYLLRKS